MGKNGLEGGRLRVADDGMDRVVAAAKNLFEEEI